MCWALSEHRRWRALLPHTHSLTHSLTHTLSPSFFLTSCHPLPSYQVLEVLSKKEMNCRAIRDTGAVNALVKLAVEAPPKLNAAATRGTSKKLYAQNLLRLLLHPNTPFCVSQPGLFCQTENSRGRQKSIPTLRTNILHPRICVFPRSARRHLRISSRYPRRLHLLCDMFLHQSHLRGPPLRSRGRSKRFVRHLSVGRPVTRLCSVSSFQLTFHSFQPTPCRFSHRHYYHQD